VVAKVRERVTVSKQAAPKIEGERFYLRKLNDVTYSRVRVGKTLFNMFPVRKCLEQGNSLSPLFFNFALEYAIRMSQVNHDGLKLNGLHQFLVYANELVYWEEAYTL